MAKKKKKIGTGLEFDSSGLDAIISEATDIVDKDLAKMLGEAYKRATASERADMLRWFDAEHRRPHGGKHVADAWNDGKVSVTKKGLKVSYVFGYDSRQTLVPIFLEYGTPRITPEYRMKSVHEKCAKEVDKTFMDELIAALRPSGLIE